MPKNGRVAPSLTTGDVGRKIREERLRQQDIRSPDAFCQAVTKAGYPLKVPSLFQWENGHRAIPLSALPYLAKALRTNCAYLVSGMNCRKTKEKRRK